MDVGECHARLRKNKEGVSHPIHPYVPQFGGNASSGLEDVLSQTLIGTRRAQTGTKCMHDLYS